MRALTGRMKRTHRVLIVAALGSTLPGCIGVFDIFNRSTYDLPSGYCLELDREFDHYRLQDCSSKGRGTEGIGVSRGTVSHLGWNDRVIVANRYAALGNEGSGWVILDLATDKLEGAFSDEAWKAKLNTDARLAGVEIRRAEDVLK